ncbi:hypothetical protein ACOME3_006784 [Neoechinorhynchus agilis]
MTVDFESFATEGLIRTREYCRLIDDESIKHEIKAWFDMELLPVAEGAQRRVERPISPIEVTKIEEAIIECDELTKMELSDVIDKDNNSPRKHTKRRRPRVLTSVDDVRRKKEEIKEEHSSSIHSVEHDLLQLHD